MKVSYEEIGHISATFAASSGEAGQVCRMAGNGQVTPCADGEMFCGVMEGIRKGYTGVQLHGFAEVVYTGTAPNVGYVNLLANGSGGVKVGSAGRSYLAVSVDTANQTVVIEL